MGVQFQVSGDTKVAKAKKRLRWVLSLLAVVLAVLGWEVFQVFSAPPLEPAQKALLSWKDTRTPDFVVKTDEGKTIRLSDFKGKRVILNFWATWCPPCREELPNFVKLRNVISPADVEIIGISTDAAATQRKFAEQHGINYPLTILKNAPSPYQDVTLIPTTMVIDRHGVLQNILFGPQGFGTLRKYATESDFTGRVKAAPSN